MQTPGNIGDAGPGESSPLAIDVFKHDVKNQLSNILLAIEQLRHEITGPSEDCLFYLDCIAKASAKIDALVKDVG